MNPRDALRIRSTMITIIATVAFSYIQDVASPYADSWLGWLLPFTLYSATWAAIAFRVKPIIYYIVAFSLAFSNGFTATCMIDAKGATQETAILSGIKIYCIHTFLALCMLQDLLAPVVGLDRQQRQHTHPDGGLLWHLGLGKTFVEDLNRHNSTLLVLIAAFFFCSELGRSGKLWNGSVMKEAVEAIFWWVKMYVSADLAMRTMIAGVVWLRKNNLHSREQDREGKNPKAQTSTRME